GFVEGVNRLEDYLYRDPDVGRRDQLRYFCRDLFVREELIDALGDVLRMQLTGTLQLLATIVEFLQTVFFTAVFHQFNCGPEGDEIAHLAHVDAIAIRITYLRGRGNNNNLLWLETGQHPDDAFFQGGAPHDGVVDDDEGVHS